MSQKLSDLQFEQWTESQIERTADSYYIFASHTVKAALDFQQLKIEKLAEAFKISSSLVQQEWDRNSVLIKENEELKNTIGQLQQNNLNIIRIELENSFLKINFADARKWIYEMKGAAEDRWSDDSIQKLDEWLKQNDN